MKVQESSRPDNISHFCVSGRNHVKAKERKTKQNADANDALDGTEKASGKSCSNVSHQIRLSVRGSEGADAIFS